MKKFSMATMVVLLAGMASAAPEIRPLPWQTMVKFNATHVLEIDHGDLTETSTNTTMVLTNTVSAPVSVQFVGMLLDAAFDSVATNSMTVSCGTAAAPTLWLNAKEVCSDGTEIRSSFGGDYTATAALVATTASLTNLLAGAAAGDASVTNVTDAALVTGVTGTVTVASPIVNEQSSDVTIHTTFGPAGADVTHAALTQGKMRLFFRLWQPGM